MGWICLSHMLHYDVICSNSTYSCLDNISRIMTSKCQCLPQANAKRLHIWFNKHTMLDFITSISIILNNNDVDVILIVMAMTMTTMTMTMTIMVITTVMVIMMRVIGMVVMVIVMVTVVLHNMFIDNWWPWYGWLIISISNLWCNYSPVVMLLNSLRPRDAYIRR